VDPLGLVECRCTATSTGGIGYDKNKHKVCSYKCTSGDKTATVAGGSDSGGSGGDMCYGADADTGVSRDGQTYAYARSQLPFNVNTESLVDRYIRYDSKFLDSLDKSLGNAK
jgi:hypothetical protein